jgi:hypothetical protein
LGGVAGGRQEVMKVYPAAVRTGQFLTSCSVYFVTEVRTYSFPT